jgi:16S rRNA (adenine1518-N6/adenine1519-N6)-dimethyltransferase
MAFAKKSLGQNFLISPRIVEAIAKAGELKEGETVIEIGPGKGALTKALLATGAKVKAVEKDTRLIPILSEEFRKDISEEKFDLIHADILETPLENLVSADEPYKVIANIPYYITGAIIKKFLSEKNAPKSMILMVQKEVATRIMAKDSKESILSLSVKAYATPELVMNVSRGNFFPIPNVDSAVIKLTNAKKPFEDNEREEKFFEYVKTGFSSKRKKLISNLEAVETKENLKEKFAKLGLSENTRAEDVSLENWIKLSA